MRLARLLSQVGHLSFYVRRGELGLTQFSAARRVSGTSATRGRRLDLG